MAEIINLRRARKAKARADDAAEADANRVKNGVGGPERNRVKAEGEKLSHDLDACRLSPSRDKE